MLRMLVRSVSLVAILAGTAAAAGDPLPVETGRPATHQVVAKKVVKKKTTKKLKKKAARQTKKTKQAKKAKKPVSSSHATP